MRLCKRHTLQMAATMPKNISPIIAPFYEQKAVLEQWKIKLKGDKRYELGLGATSLGVDEEPYHTQSTRVHPYLSIKIKNPYNEKRKDDFWSELRFNRKNELVIYHHALYQYWHIREKAQLNAYIDVVQSFFEEAHQHKLKKSKIRSLKQHSILAKIREIAKEDGFEYNYDSNTKWVTLRIKVSERDALSIQIPFHNFQETLPKVRPVIQTILAQHNSGVHFRIGKYSTAYWQSSK